MHPNGHLVKTDRPCSIRTPHSCLKCSPARVCVSSSPLQYAHVMCVRVHGDLRSAENLILFAFSARPSRMNRSAVTGWEKKGVKRGRRENRRENKHVSQAPISLPLLPVVLPPRSLISAFTSSRVLQHRLKNEERQPGGMRREPPEGWDGAGEDTFSPFPQVVLDPCPLTRIVLNVQRRNIFSSFVCVLLCRICVLWLLCLLSSRLQTLTNKTVSDLCSSHQFLMR